MAKQIIKIKESDIKHIISESIKKVLSESPEMTSYNDDSTRRYKIRNNNNGYQNFHDVRAEKGQGAKGLSYMKFGNGGNDNGHIDNLIDELSGYLNCSPEEIKMALGNLR